MIRLFHGTSAQLSRLSEERIGLGHSPNSALGVWLTADPLMAATYAGDFGVVLIAATTPLTLAVAHDWTQAVWGGPDLHLEDREVARARFAVARTRLRGQGFDGIWCNMPGTDLESAICLVDPARIRIVGSIPSAAQDLLQQIPHALRGIRVNFRHCLEDVLLEIRKSCPDLAAGPGSREAITMSPLERSGALDGPLPIGPSAAAEEPDALAPWS